MPQQLRPRASSLGAEIRGDTNGPAISTLTPDSPGAPRTPSPRAAGPQHSKRRKARSLFQRWKTLSLTHTWVNPLILLLVPILCFLPDPTPRNPMHAALFLSYPLPDRSPLIPAHARQLAEVPRYYGKGGLDLVFVGYYIVVLSFTREFLMQRVIRPLAVRAGIRSRAKQRRFMEQAYTALYFSLFGPYGVWVMRRTPVWYFATGPMYDDYPHRAQDAPLKAYYLLQAAYWAQQAIVLLLLLEKPRKDFRELVGHHVVTLALIALSYRFHFTYMGVAVYITHDVSDFFLATAKVLNYLQSPITVPYFTFFIGVWIYLRHYINLRILFSVLTEFATRGPFDFDWAAQQYKGRLAQVICFALLATLQAINLFWLFFILRIGFTALFSDVAKDERSEDEYTEDEPAKGEEKAANGRVKEDEGKAGVATGVETRAQANGRARGGQANGGLIESEAARKEGESYADAVKDGSSNG